MGYDKTMKTAVVYYSLSGNCAFIAEELKTRLGAELLRLHTEKETTRKGRERRGPVRFFWGIFVMLGIIKAPLKPFVFDPAAYDLIIIGAPVWGGLPARPISDFLAKANITGKKICIFVCHAGEEEKDIERLNALVPGNIIVAEKSFVDPIKNIENAKQQVADLVKDLQAN